jgi:Phosphodiester glycosidase
MVEIQHEVSTATAADTPARERLSGVQLFREQWSRWRWSRRRWSRRQLLRRRRGPRKRRLRRFLRRPTVRVIGALLAAFLIWVCFSMGQALAAPGGGSISSKLAEWARDHYLSPVVTFGEWLTYQPPAVGGKPSFALTVPKGENVSPAPKGKPAIKPIIPAPLGSLAGPALPGEGQWRVLTTVKGEPAIFSTFLRQSKQYSSYVSAIVSMDPRLVKFYLHPGSEDPGPGNWGANSAPWIPPGTRTGLVATFNSGFKLNASRGGFYLNGSYHGSLVNGAASVVYYKDGTVKIGVWGRDVSMTSQVAAVRQNLKPIVDHGQVPATVDQNVETGWGFTLGGGYYVWRSGIGMTRDGRIIFVYGPALDVRELATLLQHAGVVEGMELDINPFWTSYEYYEAHGKPSNPTPVNLLPNQQGPATRYYAIYSRDFTAVYAR